MLTSLKRKPDQNASTGVLPWHPNFRNENKLPDVKVIRTSFFVNAGVTFLLLASLSFVAYQEYSLATMREQIADADAHIAQDTAASNAALATYKQFQAEEAKAKEVQAFYSQTQSMNDLLLELGSLLPSDIALASVEATDTSLVLKGFVSGLPAKASGIASAFEKDLRANKALSERYSEINLTSLGKDTGSGRMSFNLEMKRKKNEPKKGKK